MPVAGHKPKTFGQEDTTLLVTPCGHSDTYNQENYKTGQAMKGGGDIKVIQLLCCFEISLLRR